MFHRFNFQNRILLGFSIIVVLFVIIVCISFSKIKEINGKTRFLYEHPYVVSNAVRDINIDMYELFYLSMKNVVSAENEEELNLAINDMKLKDLEIYKNFNIITERFLGSKRIIKEAKELFDKWKETGEELIYLKKRGLDKEAALLRKNKGLREFYELRKKFALVTNFATNKAREVFQSSEKVEKQANFTLLSGSFVFIGLSLILSFVISKSISSPIKEIAFNAKELINSKSIYDVDKISENELLNLTINELSVAYTKLEELNATLEKKFDETTKNLKEKEILLKEIHHRVKNNLQIISSILNLQADNIKGKKTVGLIRDIQSRIRAMSLVHELIYQTNDFSNINFFEYINKISTSLISSYTQHSVNLKLDVDAILLDIDSAIPCGLIINELITNSLKYAFSDKEKGEVSLSLKQMNGFVKLSVADNGKGLPDNIDYRNTKSLGLQLVVSLVDQLEGDITLDNSNGVNYIITFKHNSIT